MSPRLNDSQAASRSKGSPHNQRANWTTREEAERALRATRKSADGNLAHARCPRGQLPERTIARPDKTARITFSAPIANVLSASVMASSSGQGRIVVEKKASMPCS